MYVAITSPYPWDRGVIKILFKLPAKTLERWEEKLSKNLVENSPREALFIASQKNSSWQAENVIIDLPVDRPVDHPTFEFLTVGPLVDRPVDRAKPAGRLPGRPALPERWAVSVGRPPGRPAF